MKKKTNENPEFTFYFLNMKLTEKKKRPISENLDMGLQLLLLPVVSYQVWNLSREPSLHVKLESSVNCVLRQT